MKYGIVTLVVVHFVIHLTYLACDFWVADWEITIFNTYAPVKLYDFMSFYFYGLDGIVLALIILLSNKDYNLWIDRQLVKVTAGDLLIRGLIYAVHHLKIYCIGSKERVYSLLQYTLIAIGFIVVSGRRYGYFKN